MKTFTDTCGRTWTVSVNVATVKRVKDLLGVNLMEAITGDLIQQLEVDPILLVDILYVACKGAADANGVSDEDFGQALGGDALEKATDAFLEELIDFFPEAKRRIFRQAFQKMKEAEMAGIAKAAQRLDSLDIEAMLESRLKNT